jgi:hypothetical protein
MPRLPLLMDLVQKRSRNRRLVTGRPSIYRDTVKASHAVDRDRERPPSISAPFERQADCLGDLIGIYVADSIRSGQRPRRSAVVKLFAKWLFGYQGYVVGTVRFSTSIFVVPAIALAFRRIAAPLRCTASLACK